MLRKRLKFTVYYSTRDRGKSLKQAMKWIDKLHDAYGDHYAVWVEIEGEDDKKKD